MEGPPAIVCGRAHLHPPPHHQVLRNCNVAAECRDMEGLPTFVRHRTGLRPSARRVRRNSDVTIRGGELERLGATFDGRRTDLRPLARQVLSHKDVAVSSGRTERPSSHSIRRSSEDREQELSPCPHSGFIIRLGISVPLTQRGR